MNYATAEERRAHEVIDMVKKPAKVKRNRKKWRNRLRRLKDPFYAGFFNPHVDVI